MTSQYIKGLAVLAGAAAFAVFAPKAALTLVGVACMGLALYWMGRCRHGGRLGLLPPTVDNDGTRLPARWFCDACGRSWPANLESDHAPVVRFSGFDQTKLPASARRAAALEKQRQSLAVKRAALAVNREEVARASSAPNVTSIAARRAAR